MALNWILQVQFIDFTSTPLHLHNEEKYVVGLSFFLNCSDGKSCGCINATCSHLILKEDCFDKSYSPYVGVLYSSCPKANISLLSLTRSSVNAEPLPYDTWYLSTGYVAVRNVNVSRCHALEASGFQANGNKDLDASYLLAAEGIGRDSLELSRQTFCFKLSSFVILNNQVDKKYGTVLLYRTDSAAFKNSIFSGNNGTGFINGKMFFENCFYFSEFDTGLASVPNGLNIINKATITWMTPHFMTNNCHQRTIFNIYKKDGILTALGLSILNQIGKL